MRRTAPAALAEIRAQFPALTRTHAGFPVAYFDGPGGTQVPRAVIDAMAEYLALHNANTHWAFPSSVETDAMLVAAREAMADFLNCAPDEIAFGNNMTTITFHLARALGRAWGPGDEVVVTELDHQANVAPWMAVARERGITVRIARLRPETGTLDLDHLAAQIGSQTRLVAVGAASNAIGTITDVAAVAEVARAHGAMVFVDAVHYAPHMLVDVQAMGCDFLACSAYKFYGPHVGVLFGRRARLAALDVPKLAPAPDTVPERLETGTQNHEGIAGAMAAVDFLASLGTGTTRRERLVSAFGMLHGRGTALCERLWHGLGALPGVRVYGVPPEFPRTPTVSFTIRGLPSEIIARRLVERGLFASNGDFYATTVVSRLGHAADGLLRVGCACYTSEEEVERMVAAVGEMVGD